MLNQAVFLVNKFSRKEARLFQPGDENAVAFPQRQVEQALVLNPGQGAFVRLNQLSSKLIYQEDKCIPIFFIRKTREGEQTFELKVPNP